MSINILKPHLAINVKNVEASIGFYKSLFGIEPSKVRTGYAKFDVQQPSLNFTLNQVPFSEQGALSHLGIQVESTDDVLALRYRWRESGLLPREEMQTTCCYALQDKAWVTDPDGNEWEVFTVIEGDLPERAAEGETTCCASPADSKIAATVTVETAGCDCEENPPAEGKEPCCGTQAAKFDIEVKPGSNSVPCC